MSTSHPPIGGHPEGFGATVRQDKWWVEPGMTLFVFTAFVIYTTWAAFQGEYYWWSDGQTEFGGYLSPFYSPVLAWTPAAGAPPADHWWIWDSWFSWWPGFLPKSPAFLILIFPGAFRLTCYYYRKAYYRAYAGTPPGCSVGPIKQKKYRGETRLMLFQNLHRYTMYFAIVFVFILSWDAIQGFWQGGKFGVGVGSIILTLNAILLAGYVFGCHSFRHVIGGKLNRFSGCSFAQMRHGAWKGCSMLNRHHMIWAWLSLFWVGITDAYIRMLASGWITDYNTWG